MTITETLDGEIVICGGGAQLEDTHLASVVHCIDEEIHDWLEKRERRNERRDHDRTIDR